MELDQEDIYTVSRLNNEVKSILEECFPYIWVEGEISNFAAPHSGHFYFSLKDATAQVRCAMFRSNQRKLNFTPKDGLHVMIKARVSLYENRGEYQLIAEAMEERGEGKLRREFELLKKKLEAAGLFAESHKKPLPPYPTKIGVITSATGAAIRDILTVLKRRYPCVPVIIYPTLVQGTTAAPTIVKAIATANQRQECDVLILSRGGGSLEDLWPFNEEIVAHAIYKSDIPIISGIGHEVDFTIADFVADVRAPTPSAAAEIATPDRMELLAILARQTHQLSRQMHNKISHSQQQIDWTSKHLLQLHPKRKLLEKTQQLDYFELHLVQLQHRFLNKLQLKWQENSAALLQQNPQNRIQACQYEAHGLLQQLSNLMRNQLDHKQNLLANAASTLDAISPLATLKRGFAIVTKGQKVLHSSHDVAVGDEVSVTLSQGKMQCTVDTVLE